MNSFSLVKLVLSDLSGRCLQKEIGVGAPHLGLGLIGFMVGTLSRPSGAWHALPWRFHVDRTEAQMATAMREDKSSALQAALTMEQEPPFPACSQTL